MEKIDAERIVKDREECLRSNSCICATEACLIYKYPNTDGMSCKQIHEKALEVLKS